MALSRSPVSFLTSLSKPISFNRSSEGDSMAMEKFVGLVVILFGIQVEPFLLAAVVDGVDLHFQDNLLVDRPECLGRTDGRL